MHDDILKNNLFSKSLLKPMSFSDITTPSFIKNNSLNQKIKSPVSSFVGSKYNKRFGTNLNNISDGASLGVNALKGLGVLKSYDNSNTTKTIDTAWDAASNFAGPVAPFMKAASVVKDIGQSFGLRTDQMTGGDKFFDSTPGFLLGGWANSAFGKRANKTEFDREVINKTGSSYGGLSKSFDEADKKANKKYGLFSRGSRKRANKQINLANERMGTLSNIFDQSETDKESSRNPFNGLRNRFSTTGGWDHNYSGKAFLAKKGMKLNLDFANKVLNRDDKLNVFKKGGKMNVIPDGKLHAHLNHMQDTLDVTRKGIPVISKSDGGTVIQHAEIEKEEIIFTLEVTEKLEKLKKINTDESAIEAGKLLVKEILDNTKDNTDLINKIKI